MSLDHEAQRALATLARLGIPDPITLRMRQALRIRKFARHFQRYARSHIARMTDLDDRRNVPEADLPLWASALGVPRLYKVTVGGLNQVSITAWIDDSSRNWTVGSLVIPLRRLRVSPAHATARCMTALRAHLRGQKMEKFLDEEQAKAC